MKFYTAPMLHVYQLHMPEEITVQDSTELISTMEGIEEW